MQVRKPDGSNAMPNGDAAGNLVTTASSTSQFPVQPVAGAEFAVKTASGTNLLVTVPAAAAISPAIDLTTYRLARIGCPADVGLATVMSFQVATSLGGTYRDLYDQYGSEYTVKVANNRAVVPDLTMFAGARFLKIRFGTSAAPTVYANGRDVDLSLLA